MGLQRGQPEKRRYPRFPVGGRIKGRVRALYDASLMDVSVGGALIEHAQIVRPGSTSFLILFLHGRPVNLRCSVVWSHVDRPELQPDGERALIFRTGLEFLESTDEILRLLSDYLEMLRR
ncbi:MAG: PilZ domain-containing protein [Candidatus Methylomirabilales bacterium]